MSPSAALSSATQAELLRKDGNSYFKKGRFGAAIDAYTEAITLCPNIPVYLTNRARCHVKRSEWTRVEEDCRKAIQLDNKSVKGHYMLGLALLRKEEFADGIKQLERALDLGRGADPEGNMVDEIWDELSKAKFKEWERESTMRMWDMQNLKEACVTALKQKHLLDDFQASGLSEESNAANLEQLKAVDRVFESASNADTPNEVPDHLCCKINLEILRDPVITPCGVTYERSVIVDHLRKVGKFDPITRDPLEEPQLIPNLAIKEAVQSFLQKHGWAYNPE